MAKKSPITPGASPATNESVPTAGGRIIDLRIENVKRLKAVEIRPDGSSVVEITGRNGQGKSSVLDAIAFALGGKSQQPQKPMRDGTNKASVLVDLGNIVVERTWNAGGNTYLVVRNKEGLKFNSPQQILDELVGQLTFDPLAFSRMQPKDQVATLKAIAGLDFTSIEQRRQTAYDRRTLVNRDLKSAEAQLDALPEVNAPDQEVSIAVLTDELQDAIKQQRQNSDARNQAEQRKSRAANQVQIADSERTRWASTVADLERKLAEARGELEKADSKLDDARKAHDAEVLAADEYIKGLPGDPDIEPLQNQIAGAEETNSRVRQKKQRAAAAARVAAFRKESEQLSADIESIDQEKADALAAAKFPVEGLSFTADGITLNGLPFEQACSSEQLRVSVAIGLALNPNLKIMLVRDGSLLDTDGRQLLAEFAEQAGAQIWLERATDGEPIGVVIEDGEVRMSSEEADVELARN